MFEPSETTQERLASNSPDDAGSAVSVDLRAASDAIGAEPSTAVRLSDAISAEVSTTEADGPPLMPIEQFDAMIGALDSASLTTTLPATHTLLMCHCGSSLVVKGTNWQIIHNADGSHTTGPMPLTMSTTTAVDVRLVSPVGGGGDTNTSEDVYLRVARAQAMVIFGACTDRRSHLGGWIRGKAKRPEFRAAVDEARRGLLPLADVLLWRDRFFEMVAERDAARAALAERDATIAAQAAELAEARREQEKLANTGEWGWEWGMEALITGEFIPYNSEVEARVWTRHHKRPLLKRQLWRGQPVPVASGDSDE